jgi:hypothetical protein
MGLRIKKDGACSGKGANKALFQKLTYMVVKALKNGKNQQFLHAQAVPHAAVAAGSSLLSALALYFTYPDYRVLALLFCLMAIIAGITKTGAFIFLSRVFIARAGTVRRLSATLIALCFFFSMLITNDVALLTFVPFAITVLTMGGLKEQICRGVLQPRPRISAAYSHPSEIPKSLTVRVLRDDPGAVLVADGPPTLASFILIPLLAVGLRKKRIEIPDAQGTLSLDKIRLAVYCAIFCSASLVFGQVPYPITLPSRRWRCSVRQNAFLDSITACC